MRIAFISDVHGNSVALEKVIMDINRKNIDQIVILGDICFRGPDPKKSLDLVRSLSAKVIKGNADEWIVRGIRRGEVPDGAFEIMSQEREFGKSLLHEEDLQYLKNLPTDIKLTADEYEIHCFHATPHNLFQNIMPDASDETFAKEILTDCKSDIFLYGHIHRPFIRYVNGKIIMNPGSVGLPFDGMPLASYGIIEVEGKNVQTEIHRVEYDIKQVIKMYEKNDYPNIGQMALVLRQGRPV